MQPPDDQSAVLALALPPPDLDLTIDPGTVVVTRHAVQRYRERVEGVPRRLAERRLRDLIAVAQWRSRPRAWTEIVLHPDVIYGYSPDRPDVCLLLRGQVLVTVLSNRVCTRGKVVITRSHAARPGGVTGPDGFRRASWVRMRDRCLDL